MDTSTNINSKSMQLHFIQGIEKVLKTEFRN